MTVTSLARAVALAAVATYVAACSGSGAAPSAASPASAPAAAASASSSSSASPAPASSSSAAASPSTAASPAGAPSLAGCPTAQPSPMAAADAKLVTLTTAKGTIVIKVEGKLAPIAAANFVALASCGYYTGVVFHRLVPGFVIQGGDGRYGRVPNVDKTNVGTGGPAYTIQDEPVTGSYTRGTVAMAKTQQPNSANSQFFIVLADVNLPATYQIFGHVTSGMEAVDAIAAMPNTGGDANQAVDPVAMDTVTVSNP